MSDDHTTAARRSRNRVAAATRWHRGRREENDARRAHKALMLEQHITKLVDAAPPLTAGQLARLRTLLTPPPAGNAPVHVEERAA